MKFFEKLLGLQDIVTVSSEQLNENKLLKEEDDEVGRQIHDGVTTGNSTKIFYDDGTTETTLHPLGPSTDAIEGVSNPVSIEIPEQTPWTAKVQDDGSVTTVHGGFDSPLHDIPADTPDCIFLPPPVPWTATVNDDGTVTAEHGNPNNLPYDDEPEICVDFPVVELTYTSVCGPVELTWESDCGLPIFSEENVIDGAITEFIKETSTEAPLGAEVDDGSSLSNIANDSSVMTGLSEALLVVNSGVDTM